MSRWALILAGTLGAIGGALAQPQSLPEASRVRILLVLDTLDHNGISWGLDGENMKALLEHAFTRQGLKPGKNFTIDVLTGKKVTSAEVLGHYRNLDTSSGEALVFYYSGHGGYHAKKGHFLALTVGQQRLFRNDLLAAMNTKQPRFRAVLTDCCANLAGGAYAAEPRDVRIEPAIGKGTVGRKAATREPEAMIAEHTVRKPLAEPSRPDLTAFLAKYERAKAIEPASNVAARKEKDIGANPKATRGEPPSTVGKGTFIRTATGATPLQEVLDKSDGKIVRQLLFQPRGLVDINGSLKGQPSMGQHAWGGSFFTLAFIHVQADTIRNLDLNNNNIVEWDEFFPAWRDMTRRVSRGTTRGQAVQTPEAWLMNASK